MLSLLDRPDALREARNLIPDTRVPMRARPGTVQVDQGATTAAEWAAGALWVVQDGVLEPFGTAANRLDAQPFQALTDNALREVRVYFADGMAGLWYAVEEPGDWEPHTVVNTVTTIAGVPYPIPIPVALAVWRARLWLTNGSNRIVHSGLEDPASWNPLASLEFQGAREDRVLAIVPMGERLLVGLQNALWSVEGFSEFDWTTTELVSERGIVNRQGLVSDGDQAYYLSAHGVFELGSPLALSAGWLDPLFEVPDPWGALSLTPDGRYLFALIRGRVLVMHRQAKTWGEVVFPGEGPVLGFIRTEQELGVYGADGVWLLGNEDRADTWMDGTRDPVAWVYRTWPDYPGTIDGVAVLDATRIHLRGGTNGEATYTAESDYASVSYPIETTDHVQDLTELAFWDGNLLADAETPAWREFRPVLSGRRFSHQLAGSGRIEVIRFEPEYRAGGNQ